MSANATTNGAIFSRMGGNYRVTNGGRSSESDIAHTNLIGGLLPAALVTEFGT
jgi:hypothetical protein